MKKVGVVVLALIASFSVSAKALPISGQIINVCSEAPDAAIQTGLISSEVQKAYKAYLDKFKPNPDVNDAAQKNVDKCYGNVSAEFTKLYPDVKID